MNAGNFYEEFKDALKFLGPGWYGKNEIKIRAKKNKIILSYGNLEMVIKPEKEGKSK